MFPISPKNKVTINQKQTNFIPDTKYSTAIIRHPFDFTQIAFSPSLYIVNKGQPLTRQTIGTIFTLLQFVQDINHQTLCKAPYYPYIQKEG